MADVQLAMRLHHRVNPLEHAALRRCIEINHHVAAEHDVERLAQLPVRLHQVVRPEFDEARELGLDADEAAVRALAAQEMRAQPRLRQAARFRRINAARRDREHLGVDVARDDLYAGAAARRLGHSHRDRVGLFAGRCGVAPDSQRPRAVFLQVSRELVKVMLFAEERREVGGQAVDELLPLLGARCTARLLEPLQVACERAVAGFAQTARQAAVDHRLLAGVQADAGALVDQLANALEVGVAEAELGVASPCSGVGTSGRSGNRRQDSIHESSGGGGQAGASACDTRLPHGDIGASVSRLSRRRDGRWVSIPVQFRRSAPKGAARLGARGGP